MYFKYHVEEYFLAEKNAGILLIVVAGLLLLFAIFCKAYYKTEISRGFMYTLFILGSLQLASGIIIYRNADPERKAMVYALDMNPQQIKTTDLGRLQQRQRNLSYLMYVELFLGLVSVAGIILYRSDSAKYFLLGISIGLLVPIIPTYLVHFGASERAKQMITKINDWKPA